MSAPEETTPAEEQNPFGDSPYEERQPASEAGGVAWVDLFTPDNGTKISLTERHSTGIKALDAIMAAISYGARKYGLLGRRPTEALAPPPADSAAPTFPTEPTPVQTIINAQPRVCAVKSVKHIRTKSQRSMLVVTTAEFPDGAIAFESALPKNFNLNSLTLFVDYQPPAQMAYCTIEVKPKGNTVISFSATL